MNRMDEYRALLTELEQPMPELDTLVDRAICRRQRKQRRIKHSLTGLAVFVLSFVLLVNFCAPVAYACSRLPVLRELAQAVTFSNSLSAAVENEYVQPVELSETSQGIRAEIAYLIVDQKQVNVFYRLSSEQYTSLAADPVILRADGTSSASCAYHTNGFYEENGELRSISIDFVDGSVPDCLVLELKVYSNEISAGPPAESSIFGALPDEPEYIAKFRFKLEFDPEFTAAGRAIRVNETVVLDGQSITVSDIEIYPSHMRLDIVEGSDNTAALQDLDFYIESDWGLRFDPVSNGITATGSADSSSMVSYRADSSYFYEAKHLRLVITGAKWRYKDMPRCYLNLETGETGTLPEGVSFYSAERHGDGWIVAFKARLIEGEPMYQLFGHKYYDAQGEEYEINQWSTHYAEREEGGEANYYIDSFFLQSYPNDEVWLTPQYHRLWSADTPIEIEIK